MKTVKITWGYSQDGKNGRHIKGQTYEYSEGFFTKEEAERDAKLKLLEKYPNATNISVSSDYSYSFNVDCGGIWFATCVGKIKSERSKMKKEHFRDVYSMCHTEVYTIEKDKEIDEAYFNELKNKANEEAIAEIKRRYPGVTDIELEYRVEESDDKTVIAYSAQASGKLRINVPEDISNKIKEEGDKMVNEHLVSNRTTEKEEINMWFENKYVASQYAINHINNKYGESVIDYKLTFTTVKDKPFFNFGNYYDSNFQPIKEIEKVSVTIEVTFETNVHSSLLSKQQNEGFSQLVKQQPIQHPMMQQPMMGQMMGQPIIMRQPPFGYPNYPR